MDAGKRHHALVVRAQDGHYSRPLRFETNRQGFEHAVEFIKTFVGFPYQAAATLVGIEFAGYYGFTFAHFLHELTFPIVNVLPSHTKRWKEVMHRQPLKTDEKDSVSIADLVLNGHYVQFPFLEQEYAELRFLTSSRERLTMQRRAVISRLRSILDIVFPEFDTIFPTLTTKTPLALLHAHPGPVAILQASKRKIVHLLRTQSRNHLGVSKYLQLAAAARHTVALTNAQGAMRDEIPLLIERLWLYDQQIKYLNQRMVAGIETMPAAAALLTIPHVAPVTAAVFLGCVGDPRSYDSSRQIIALAGLTLVERSSGMSRGRQRISKRGRPVLRKFAHLFAVRSVQKDGLLRARFEALLSRNGGRKIPALTALSRYGLRLMYAVARSERPFTSTPPLAKTGDE